MAATISTMQDLGKPAVDFDLPDVTSDSLVRLSDFVNKPLLIMFICNHCPYVIHLISALSVLANEYQQKGYAVIAISSNDVMNYPQDDPKEMVKFAEKYRFEFPYCYDESQDVAIGFDAVCTPDLYIYDREHKLRYRGQMDDSRPANALPVSGNDLRAALEAVLNSASVSEFQTPSVGCNIKWKADRLLL